MEAVGRCYCGRVEFTIGCEVPQAASYCHCTNCRLAHAAPLYHCMYVPAEQFKVTKGEDIIDCFSKVDYLKRFFCSNCGSRVYNSLEISTEGGRWPKGRYIGTFQSLLVSPVPEKWQPTRHVHCKDAIVNAECFFAELPHFTSHATN